jgi:hypothetical protein
MKKYSNINELLKDVDKGVEVYCKSANYKVVKKGFEYYIKASTGMMINVFNGDGELNEDINSFFSI